MYPETDIPPILVTKNEIETAKNNIPKPWDESLAELQKKYNLNTQLAEQIFDSQYIDLFEKIIEKTKVNPTFIASVLCSSITNLERSGLNSKLLNDEEILKSFNYLENGKITKESIEMIFETIMAGKSSTVEEAIKNTSIETLDEAKIEQIIEKIINENKEIIQNQKERAVGPLMGIAMKDLRGKASGEMINNLLLKKIKKILESE
jgi:glutamyl-tRNA(Gln) amidotransferase subunit E